MASDADRIADALEADVFVRHGVALGVVNQRALARHLVGRLGLATTTENAAKAIKRHLSRSAGRAAPFADVQSILAGVRLTTRTQIAALELWKLPETQAAIGHVFATIDWSKGETIRVAHGERTVEVLLDEGNHARLLGMVPPSAVVAQRMGLAELSVEVGRAGIETPGLLLCLLAALKGREINLWSVLETTPETLLFVDQKDLTAAQQALIGLRDQHVGFLAQRKGRNA